VTGSIARPSVVPNANEPATASCLEIVSFVCGKARLSVTNLGLCRRVVLDGVQSTTYEASVGTMFAG
jgi:hypothetical protein